MDDLTSEILSAVIEFATEAVTIERNKKAKRMVEHLFDPNFLLEEENRFIRGEDMDAATICRIGDCYYHGTMPGKPQDKKQAAFYYNRAAEMNDARAQYSLAVMMINEEGGEIYHDGAPELLMQSAGSGHTEAMILLGDLLCSGRWILDFAMAAEWYESAAEKGNLEAQIKVAELYAREPEVKDFDKLVYWLREASQNGYKEAEELLPDMEAAGYGRTGALAFGYYQGTYGKEKDLEKAAYWMKKAAVGDNYNSRAQYIYGRMVELGEGGLYPSKEEAIRWYKKAAESWEGDAIKALRRLKKEERGNR